MKTVTKAMSWALVCSAILSAACGNNEKSRTKLKGSGKGDTSVETNLKIDESAGPSDEALAGTWFRGKNVSAGANGFSMSRVWVWTIDKDRKQLTSTVYCAATDKSTRDQAYTASVTITVDIKTTKNQMLIPQKMEKIEMFGKNKNIQCAVKEEKQLFDIKLDNNNTMLTLRKAKESKDFGVLPRLKDGENNINCLQESTNVAECAAAPAPAGAGNRPAGGTQISETTAAMLTGKWLTYGKIFNNMSNSLLMQFNDNGTMTVTKTCYWKGKDPVSVVATSKIVVNDSEIVLAGSEEAKSKEDVNGDFCTHKIADGHMKFSLSEDRRKLTTSIADNPVIYELYTPENSELTGK